MKDQEVALIVVGLAGLAFLMAKSTTDRPSENARGSYDDPRPPPPPKLVVTGGEPLELKKVTFAKEPDIAAQAEQEMELWRRTEGGYSDYRANLQGSIQELMDLEQAGNRDPMREGLRKSLNKLNDWAAHLRSRLISNLTSFQDAGGRQPSYYEQFVQVLDRDLAMYRGILKNNHDKWLDRRDAQVPQEVLQQFFSLQQKKEANFYEDRRQFNATIAMETDAPSQLPPIDWDNVQRRDVVPPQFRLPQPTEHYAPPLFVGSAEDVAGRHAGFMRPVSGLEAGEGSEQPGFDFRLTNARQLALPAPVESNADLEGNQAQDGSGPGGMVSVELRADMSQENQDKSKALTVLPNVSKPVKPAPIEQALLELQDFGPRQPPPEEGFLAVAQPEVVDHEEGNAPEVVDDPPAPTTGRKRGRTDDRGRIEVVQRQRTGEKAPNLGEKRILDQTLKEFGGGDVRDVSEEFAVAPDDGSDPKQREEVVQGGGGKRARTGLFEGAKAPDKTEDPVAPEGPNEAFRQYWDLRDRRIMQLVADFEYKRRDWDPADEKELGMAFYELYRVNMFSNSNQGTWTRADGKPAEHFKHSRTFLLINKPDYDKSKSMPAVLLEQYAPNQMAVLAEIQQSPEYRHYVTRIPALAAAAQRVGKLQSPKYYREL